MTFFSVKLDGRSVAIDCARISTAWLSSPCFFTKSSLAKMAAALPSDVGLKRQNLACLLSFCKNLHGSGHARALQLGEGVINHGRLHNLLESVVSLELCVPVRKKEHQKRSDWPDKPWNQNQQNTNGLFVECLWFLYAILAKCSGFVPNKSRRSVLSLNAQKFYGV